jgi:hypothetical protein
VHSPELLALNQPDQGSGLLKLFSFEGLANLNLEFDTNDNWHGTLSSYLALSII